MLVTQCMLFGGRVVSIVALHQAYVFSDVNKTSVMSMTKMIDYRTLCTAIYEFQVHGVTGFRLPPR